MYKQFNTFKTSNISSIATVSHAWNLLIFFFGTVYQGYKTKDGLNNFDSISSQETTLQLALVGL